MTDYLSEGDYILYDGGDRIVLVLDADDVYKQVYEGKTVADALPFGAYNQFIARNMMVYGAVLSSDLDDEAKVGIDASALNTLQFDSSKLMDTIEINIKTGKASIDTDGSEISDLEPYDSETKTGDYAIARFCDKGSLQEIVIYRFVN